MFSRTVSFITRAALAILFVSFPSFSNAQTTAIHGGFIEVRDGKKFTMSKIWEDTIRVVDPITGDTVQQSRMHLPLPVEVNGNKIYNNAEVTTPVMYNKEIAEYSFEEYILKSLYPEFREMPDGKYKLSISDPVIDKKGHIIYYEFLQMETYVRTPFPIADSLGMVPEEGYYTWKTLDSTATKPFAKKMDRVLAEARVLTPARVENMKVYAFYPAYFYQYEVEVSNHKPSISLANSIIKRHG